MAEGIVVDLSQEDAQPQLVSLPLPTIAARKLSMLDAVRSAQEGHRLAGWEHDFGEAGVHRLDLRDAEDKTNWSLLLTRTDRMIAAGAGSATVKIRTAGNEQIPVPASVANAAMLAFLAWGEELLSRKWDLDDAISAAGSHAALDLIDPSAGWP